MAVKPRLIDIDYTRSFRSGSVWATSNITLKDQDVVAVAGEPIESVPEIGGGFRAYNWMYSDQRRRNVVK